MPIYATCLKMLVMRFADVQWPAPLSLHSMFKVRYKCMVIIIIILNSSSQKRRKWNHRQCKIEKYFYPNNWIYVVQQQRLVIIQHKWLLCVLCYLSRCNDNISHGYIDQRSIQLLDISPWQLKSLHGLRRCSISNSFDLLNTCALFVPSFLLPLSPSLPLLSPSLPLSLSTPL